MKRSLIMVLALVVIGGATEMNAQFFERLGEAARRAAENAVERNVENKVEEGVNKAFNKDTYQQNEQEQNTEVDTPRGWTCPSCGATGNTGKFCGECGTKQPTSDGSWTCTACGHAGNTGKFCGECGAKQGGTAQASVSTEKPASVPTKKVIETAYAKSDFVAGDEIFFDDTQEHEQMGEFPSQWDLLEGVAEIAVVDGAKAIVFPADGEIAPLMKDMNSYLPEKFTLELDYWKFENSYSYSYIVEFYQGNTRVLKLHFGNTTMSWDYRAPNSEDDRSGYDESIFPTIQQEEAWNHLAFSFNKRAMKIYVNGTRIANIPNMQAPQRWSFKAYRHQPEYLVAIKGVRMAKGAVPLYDRMMSDGKFITYGITFDIGKSTIKPESMGEINRIVQLMTENPTLNFSVEGHTDATGNAASNQTLSEQRAQAIVDKLVELGIAQNRLTAVGKGQGNPIADNNTDEGRAKNRRVEFVKQ